MDSLENRTFRVRGIYAQFLGVFLLFRYVDWYDFFYAALRWLGWLDIGFGFIGDFD